jgi:hypothetical protein
LAAKLGATAAWALAEFGPTYDGPQPCVGAGNTNHAATQPVKTSATLRTIYPQRTAS